MLLCNPLFSSTKFQVVHLQGKGKTCFVFQRKEQCKHFWHLLPVLFLPSQKWMIVYYSVVSISYLTAILCACMQELIKGGGYVAKFRIVWRNSYSKCGWEIFFVHWGHVISVAEVCKAQAWQLQVHPNRWYLLNLVRLDAKIKQGTMLCWGPLNRQLITALPEYNTLTGIWG